MCNGGYQQRSLLTRLRNPLTPWLIQYDAEHCYESFLLLLYFITPHLSFSPSHQDRALIAKISIRFLAVEIESPSTSSRILPS
jgi:hypothetical protein